MAWQGKSSGQFSGNWFGLPGASDPNAMHAALTGMGFLSAVLSFVAPAPVPAEPQAGGRRIAGKPSRREDAEEEEFMAVLAIALQVLFPKR